MKWILPLALVLLFYGSAGAQQKLPVAPKESDYPEISKRSLTRTVKRSAEVIRSGSRMLKRGKRCGSRRRRFKGLLRRRC